MMPASPFLRRLTFPVGGLILLLGFSACEQPKPVEVATPTRKDPVESRPNTNPRTREGREFTDNRPTPGPAATPTPAIYFHPDDPDTATDLLLKPSDFAASAGRADEDGGWMLDSNGVLHIRERRIPFEIYRIEVEVKGTPVREIWPEFHLAMYHHGHQRNFQAMPTRSNFAVTRDWQVQVFEPQKPLPAGQYRLDFRMLNAHRDEETSEARVLHVRRIAFKGSKSLGANIITD